MIIPSDISVKDNHLEKQGEIIRHRRAILQLFNIKVIVYPERIEIRGTIPSQVLDKTVKKELGTAPIISSPSEGEGDTGGKFYNNRLIFYGLEGKSPSTFLR